MAELVPYPLGPMAARMLREAAERRSVFDLPERKMFRAPEGRSYGVSFHGKPAGTPLGPAAGPHTQMAQNLVLSWLGGGRIFELKTVQILDQLDIPRPCIDMETVGYNVEWSQELRLEQSLEEYVKGAMLIRILAESGELDLGPGHDDIVFDMSVGYDLEGIRSDRVQRFIADMRDARQVVDRLRGELPASLARYRDLDYPTGLSDTLTLSTFHGCPPDEIERIVEHLLELGLSVVVKLNPTLLGPEETRRLLHDVMGYHEVRVPDAAFERDTSWQQAVDFTGRLRERARGLGLGFGIKLTNTLLCDNHRDFFPAEAKEMYLSGPPLHVLAMGLVRRFRREFGAALPISFSGGIDRQSFPDAVSLGLVPVTVCSDLLQTGGYGRAYRYFDELGGRMDAVGASDVPGFVLRGQDKALEALDRLGLDDTQRERCLGALEEGAEARALDPELLERWRAEAILLNTEAYVGRATADPRYAAEQHRKGPKRIDSSLELFDCVTCDICVPVCPNAANFTFTPDAKEVPVVVARRDGDGWVFEEREPLPLRKRHQIATFADFCNECGNCDVFCPEEGAPYVLKPRFFRREEDLDRFADHQGFFLESTDQGQRMRARFPGGEYTADLTDGVVRYSGPGFSVTFTEDDPRATLEGSADGAVDLTFFHIMDVLRRTLSSAGAIDWVAAALRERAPAAEGR